MKVRDLIRMIEKDGWFLVRTTGSHRIFKHDAKPGIVVVPGHAGDEVPPGTLKSALGQAGLR